MRDHVDVPHPLQQEGEFVAGQLLVIDNDADKDITILREQLARKV